MARFTHRVADACASREILHSTSWQRLLVAHAVPVAQEPLNNIRKYLSISVWMCPAGRHGVGGAQPPERMQAFPDDCLPEPSFGLHQVVVDNAQRAKITFGGVVVVRKREMEPGFEPPGRFADVKRFCSSKEVETRYGMKGMTGTTCCWLGYTFGDLSQHTHRGRLADQRSRLGPHKSRCQSREHLHTKNEVEANVREGRKKDEDEKWCAFAHQTGFMSAISNLLYKTCPTWNLEERRKVPPSPSFDCQCHKLLSAPWTLLMHITTAAHQHSINQSEQRPICPPTAPVFRTSSAA